MAFLNSLSSSSTFESGQNFVAAADHLACHALLEETGNFLNIYICVCVQMTGGQLTTQLDVSSESLSWQAD